MGNAAGICSVVRPVYFISIIRESPAPSKPLVEVYLECNCLAFEDLLVVRIQEPEFQVLAELRRGLRYPTQFQEHVLAPRPHGYRLFAPEDQGSGLRVQYLDLDVTGQKVLVRGVEEPGLPWARPGTGGP